MKIMFLIPVTANFEQKKKRDRRLFKKIYPSRHEHRVSADFQRVPFDRK